MKILGIDPGLHITGWGIIDYDGLHLKYVDCGIIVTNASDELGSRLGHIHKQLHGIVEKYSPQEVGIEEVFVNKNPISSLKLGMARGVAICCISLLELKASEYSPNKIKKSIVGTGHATKDQISMMVQKLLNCGSVKLDAADALAIAICHAHHSTFRMIKR
jgi:crossover junction endodeoxyribonuclease RuvC